MNKASERKVQELKIELAHSKEECEALQNKSKKLEKEKEDLQLSIAEKEQSVIIQREEHAKKAQETSEQIEQTIEAQKREHEKDWAELKKSAEEKDQKISDSERSEKMMDHE